MRDEDAGNAAGDATDRNRYRERKVDALLFDVADCGRCNVREDKEKRCSGDDARRYTEDQAQERDDDESAAHSNNRAKNARDDAHEKNLDEFDRVQRLVPDPDPVKSAPFSIGSPNGL